MPSHFAPANEKEHERANRGLDVPDYCRYCGHPFMEHTNGRCLPKCEHERLTEDGICRGCGEDRRGI